MTTIFETRQELELERTPVYKVQFEDGTTISSGKLRVNHDWLDELDACDELFGIDEFKAYEHPFAFPYLDRSPLADMFLFDHEWQVSGGDIGAAGSVLQIPQTTTPMQIIPEQGHVSVSSIQLGITDYQNIITEMLTRPVFGQRMTLWQGFYDMSDDDFMVAYMGTIQSVVMQRDFGGYQLAIHNMQSLVNKQLFQVAHSFTRHDIDADVMRVDLEATTDFEMKGYAFIESELVRYRRDHISLVFEERGAYGSPISEHNANAPVTQCYVLGPAHPIDIRLGIYYRSGGMTWPPPKTCLCLNYDDIDWPAFARARDVIGPDWKFQFYITEPMNVMDWISNELDLVTGCYPFLTADGKLSIKAFAPATPGKHHFDHDRILANDGELQLSWSLAAGTLGQPINDVVVNYDQNPITKEYHNIYHAINQPSVELYGRFPVVINSSGLRFQLEGTAGQIFNRVASIINRYQDGAPVVTIRTHLRDQFADVGELATITSRFLPNRLTGFRGWIQTKAEIINRSVQWDDGFVDFTLLAFDLDWPYSQAVLASAPVVYYRLGESFGTMAADSSGHLYHGTYINGPTLGVAGAISGDPNTAVRFNGSTQSMLGPASSAPFELMAFSAECWLKMPPGLPAGAVAVLGPSGELYSGWLLYLYWDAFAAGIDFVLYNAPDLETEVWAEYPIGTFVNDWVHVVATHTGAGRLLYINGVKAAESGVPFTVGYTAHYPFRLGTFAGAHPQFYLNGYLDEVSIYNRALGPDEVAEHYDAGQRLVPAPGRRRYAALTP
jgi:Concanavalin A-like lectin/glucanases superfamily